MLKEVIIVIAAGAAAILITWMILRMKNKRQMQIRQAAAVLIREKKLDHALSMEMMSAGNYQTLLLLSWRDTRQQIYLFDPERGIRIGRSAVLNEVCIRDNRVSASHCRMVLKGGQVVLQDLGSANGTWVRSGLRTVRIGSDIIITNGTKLVIGGITFRVNLRMFDAAFL